MSNLKTAIYRLKLLECRNCRFSEDCKRKEWNEEKIKEIEK